MPGKVSDYIADTHALLFFWGEPERLSPRALGVLRDPDNRIFVSAASAWEISTKVRIGKLPGGEPLVRTFRQRLVEDGFVELPIESRHALRAGLLSGPHRDPFDRMLAAQSIEETVPVISRDRALSELGAKRIW